MSRTSLEGFRASHKTGDLRPQLAKYAVKARELRFNNERMSEPVSGFDCLLEYLHLYLAGGDSEIGLRFWFQQFEIARQAWQVDRCQRLWRLLVSQPLNRLTKARARMMRGLLWANLGDWSAAEAEYRRVLPIFRDEGDWRNVAYGLNNLGEVLLRQGRWVEARDAFQQSVKIKRRLNDEQALGHGLGNLAATRKLLGDYEAADQGYEEALAIARRLGDRSGEEKILSNLGILYRRLNRLTEAIEHQQASIAICQELNDIRGAALSQVNLGVAHYKRGDLDEAETALQQALNTLQNLGDLAHAAIALGNLGLIHRARGELETAETCFRESLASARAANDKASESQALSSLGLIYKTRGELDEALEYHRADVTICEAIGDKYGLAAALLNCALIHADQEDWQAARLDGGEAWKLALIEGYFDLQARLSLLWGREALLQGDDSTAAGHWREALEAAERAGELERAEVKAALERVLALLPRRRRKWFQRTLQK